MLDFKIQQIQLALFPKNFNISNKLQIASDLLVRTNNIFDQDPIIIPVPAPAGVEAGTSVPADFPEIIFKSRNEIFICKISRLRIDFFWRKAREEQEEILFSEIQRDYLSYAKEIYEYFIDERELSIGRVGFIVNFIAELEPNQSSKELIKSNLLKNGSYFATTQKLSSASLIMVEKDEAIDEESRNEWEINKRVTIESLKRKDDPEDDKAIFLQCDTNTLAEKFDSYNLSSRDIDSIISKAVVEIGNEKLNNFLSPMSVQ